MAAWRVVKLGVMSILFAVVGDAHSQQVVLNKEAYLPAPKEIADVIDKRGDLVTLTNISPDGKKFLITKSDGMPSVERLGRPHVFLGEVAFDPVANRAHDLWVRSAPGFELFYFADKRTVPVQTPTNARVSTPSWSPDGSKLAYFAHFDEATHIYVADTDNNRVQKLSPTGQPLASWGTEGNGPGQLDDLQSRHGARATELRRHHLSFRHDAMPSQIAANRKGAGRPGPTGFGSHAAPP